MGCRTRVVANNYDPENEITYSRGNLSFTSINLPRLAIEAKGDEEEFYRKLDRLEVASYKEKGNIKFVVLKSIGNAVIDKSVTQNEMSEALIKVKSGEFNNYE